MGCRITVRWRNGARLRMKGSAVEKERVTKLEVVKGRNEEHGEVWGEKIQARQCGTIKKCVGLLEWGNGATRTVGGKSEGERETEKNGTRSGEKLRMQEGKAMREE